MAIEDVRNPAVTTPSAPAPIVEPPVTPEEKRFIANLPKAVPGITPAEIAQIKAVLTRAGSSLEEAFDVMRGLASFKARYTGFETVYAAGTVGSVREYKALEKDYKNKISKYLGGTAPNFSSNEQIGDLINNRVSVKEVDDRLALAYNLHAAAPAAYKKALSDAGVTTDYQIAFIVDPVQGELLANQASADFLRQVTVATRAQQRGINIDAAQAKLISDQVASDFADYSSTQMDAEINRRVRMAGLRAQQDTRLSGFDSEQYDAFEALSADVANSNDAALMSQRRAERERARFGGTSAVRQGSLNVQRNL
jgi:hypothetical protein